MTIVVRVFVIRVFIHFALYSLICAKVTEKQYASMPDLFYHDNYDTCMGLEDEALYCQFTYELEPIDPENIPDVWKIIEEVSADRQNNYRHDHLRHGICVPFTCPSAMKSRNNTAALRDGITECYNAKFKDTGLKGSITGLHCESTLFQYPVDGLDITVAAFFIIYVAFVIFASVYERMYRYKSQMLYEYMINTRWGRLLSAFSVPKNWERLNTVKSNANIESLRSLQGIRFYNNLIVILCHTLLSLIQSKQLNPKYIENMVRSLPATMISVGSLILTTYFYMSTFLLTNNIFTRFDGKQNRVKFILSVIFTRYLRLTPTLVFVLLFYVSWLRHLGSGPHWTNVVGREYLKCRKYGWIHLLYANNVLFATDKCMGETWYLANDMQYFIISVPIICYMRNHTSSIWPILGSLLAVNIAGTFYQNYVGNYAAFMVHDPELLYDLKIILKNPQKDYQWDSFIGNLTGSIFGIGFGYLYHKYRNQKLFTSNVLFHEILVNIVCYGLSLGIIILPAIYFVMNQADHDPLIASLYLCIQKTVFILGIGYLIFATTQGIGGLSRSFLNWPPIYVLGRLTYSTYLVNAAVMFIRIGATRSPIYSSHLNIIHTFLGDTVISYIVALLLHLLVESPSLELKKIYFSLEEKAEVEKKQK